MRKAKFSSTPEKRFSHSHAKKPLEQFVGLLTPFTGVEKALQTSITRQLVMQHPLGARVALHAMEAWHEMIYYPEEVQKPIILGHLYEHQLMQTLDCGVWRRCRNIHTEKDFVHIANPCYSFEVKTTSKYNELGVCGSKSTLNAVERYRSGKRVRKKRDGYHLIVAYDRQTMLLKRIRFGWLQDIDFVASGQHRPYVTPERASIQLVTLYDHEQQ